MEIFINEVSLEGQYFTETEFKQAVKTFNAIFIVINQKIKQKKLYKDSQLLVNYEAIKGSNFMTSLKMIKDKSLKQAFTNIVFNKLNPKEWREEQVHSVSDYFDYVTETESIDVKNTSLAETAERSWQNNETIYLLINFKDSRFKLTHPSIPECFLIPIVKNNDEANPINLDCLDDKSALENWLEAKLSLSKTEYNDFSKTPPTDEQTILRDKTIFEKTSRPPVQGRSIYQEIATNRYWYVDNLHHGKAAHLEVFDKTGRHIGESDLQGNIDYSKREPNKTIDL
jgi:hypothetical protein